MKNLKNMKNARIARNMSLTIWVILIISNVLYIAGLLTMVIEEGRPNAFLYIITVIVVMLIFVMLITSIIMLVSSIKMIKRTKGRVLAIMTSSISVAYFLILFLFSTTAVFLFGGASFIGMILSSLFVPVFILAIIAWVRLMDQSNSEEVIIMGKKQKNNKPLSLGYKLKEIDNLLENNVISKEEYDELKVKIMNNIYDL